MNNPQDGSRSASVIVAGARTPTGRFRGSLSGLAATELGSIAIRAAVERSGISSAAIGYVVMGQVVTAGAGQNPARISAIGAGIPMEVPAATVNNVCLSGINSIVLADQLIRSGDYDIVVAGGMESMSQAPHLLPSAFSYGDIMVHDALERDGLWDYFTNQSMGALTDSANSSEFGISRSDQDAFAVESHRRAAAAWQDGTFADEVVPVPVPRRRGGEDIVDRDEGIRADASLEAMANLRPAFRPDGTMTAGTSSPLSDGAAAVVVTSRRIADQLGLRWLAEITAHATVAGPDTTLQLQPAQAIESACKKGGLQAADLDLVEINEAFAAVGIASTRRLGLDPARVNTDGGAIALGHPLGMSGTRITLHLALALARRGGGVGAAGLCGGGGQGEAIVLRVPAR
ncbi:MAG: acetyl-CoA C-acyltransferase [Nakamurella sp.]